MSVLSQQIAAEIVNIHLSPQLPEDSEIDCLLGIKIEEVEAPLFLPKLLVQYGSEHRIYQADNAYYYIRRLFQKLAPFRPRSILDLGSGNGRVLFYGAMLWPEIRFHGIEIIPERTLATQKLCDQLGLDTIECITGDATQAELPAVDCICLMNSFFPDVLERALPHLKAHAQKHPFLLVTVSTGNLVIEKADWLKEVIYDPAPSDELDFRFFRPQLI